jgi:dienelactone hydrolase
MTERPSLPARCLYLVPCLLAALAAGCDGCGSTTGHRDGGVDADTMRDGAVVDLGPAPDLGVGVVSRLIAYDNARGESVRGVLATPTSPGPHPAVLLLHGSGGLFRMPSVSDLGPCSPLLEAQFERWARRLVALGIVVLMPDSFGSRGFCDYNDDPRQADAFPPIPGDTDGNARRLLARLYDADAAARLLAARSDVDPSAVSLLGFSNGASTAMLYAHHRLSAALLEFAQTAEGQALGVGVPALPGPVPGLQRVIAYYPGCGFDGLLPFSTDVSDVVEFFYPASPLQVLHASLDPLLDHCAITQTGTRELQADGYASEQGAPDHYAITVYPGASHGFDAAGCESPTAPTDADTMACAAALEVTLDLLRR